MTYHGQCLATGGGSVDPIDQILHQRYFGGQAFGVAVEAGANDGLYLSSCLVFEEMGWRVINVEASHDNYLKLVSNRPNSENLFFALSDVNGDDEEICHFDFDNGGMDGSLYHRTALTRNRAPSTVFPAPTIRYDSLICEQIDLFVLDVEGMELKAIGGMMNTLYWPRVFCVEHAHVGAVLLAEILEEKYSMDYLDGLNMILVRK